MVATLIKQIYNFFVKKEDVRVPCRSGDKPDSEKSVKDKDKASVKVYTRRVGQEAFCDKKLKCQWLEELKMAKDIDWVGSCSCETELRSKKKITVETELRSKKKITVETEFYRFPRYNYENYEQLFVFTTNHRDQHNAASLCPVGMDIYPGMDIYTHNSLLVSNSEKENPREAYDSTKRYSLPNFDATENKAVKVYSNRGRDWSHSMELEQLPTFAELGNLYQS